MLAHLVEIFIKDPLRVLPFTLRGMVSAIDTCLESFSSLYMVLRVQMPQDIRPEDGLIYDLQEKAETLAQVAQTARVLNGKLGRSVDDMKSQGLTIELRHVHTMENCHQELKTYTNCYRKVTRCRLLLTLGHF